MPLIIKPGEADFMKYMNLDCILIIKTHKRLFLRFLSFLFLSFLFNGPLKKIFLIEFVTILPVFYVFFFWPQGIWDHSSLTRDQTHKLCIGKWSLNHCTIREVPESPIISKQLPFTSAISSIVFPTLILNCQYFKN